MAQLRVKDKRVKRWLARRRRNSVEYFLGYYDTKEEAEQAEEAFEVLWPKPKPTGRKGVYPYEFGNT